VVGEREEIGKSGGTEIHDPHPRHGFPEEIIPHALWLYPLFRLSLRDMD
jgi:transposase-like protein